MVNDGFCMLGRFCFRVLSEKFKRHYDATLNGGNVLGIVVLFFTHSFSESLAVS